MDGHYHLRCWRQPLGDPIYEIQGPGGETIGPKFAAPYPVGALLPDGVPYIPQAQPWLLALERAYGHGAEGLRTTRQKLQGCKEGLLECLHLDAAPGAVLTQDEADRVMFESRAFSSDAKMIDLITLIKATERAVLSKLFRVE